MKWPLKNKIAILPNEGSPGDFGYKRAFYVHSGIDLYCSDLQTVQAMESGVVVHIENFTGPNADPPSPWWLETWSVLIEGVSGVIGYCELKPLDHIKVGTVVAEGEVFAAITPVLKKDKGWGRSMLHLELYKIGTKHHVTWLLDTRRPLELLNPRFLLEKLIDQ